MRNRGLLVVAAFACSGIVLGTLTAPSVHRPPRRPGTTASNLSRGMYETKDNTHSLTFKALGFNAVNVEPDANALQGLQAEGLRGVVWLGGYDPATCTFQLSDADVTARVASIAGSPAILSYYLIDEPEQNLLQCPGIAAQIAERSRFVKKLDATHPTYIVLGDSAYVQTGNGGSQVEMYPYRRFVGAADIIGLAVYPCRVPDSEPCDFGEIATAIKRADQAQIPNYWAVIQDFGATKWRRPSVEELQREFSLWAVSRWQGYFVFSWDWQGSSLAPLADHLAALQRENLRFSQSP